MKVDGKDIVAIVNHANAVLEMGTEQREIAKKFLRYCRKILPPTHEFLCHAMTVYFKLDDVLFELKNKLKKGNIGCLEALDVLSLSYEVSELTKELEELCYSLDKILKSN